MAIALKFDGRADFGNTPAINLDAARPQPIRKIAQQTDPYFFKKVPYQSSCQLYASESLHVAAFEYTVWETISKKAMIMGILMGPRGNRRTKFWYKQITPVKELKTESNIRNFAFLP